MNKYTSCSILNMCEKKMPKLEWKNYVIYYFMKKKPKIPYVNIYFFLFKFVIIFITKKTLKMYTILYYNIQTCLDILKILNYSYMFCKHFHV